MVELEAVYVQQLLLHRELLFSNIPIRNTLKRPKMETTSDMPTFYAFYEMRYNIDEIHIIIVSTVHTRDISVLTAKTFWVCACTVSTTIFKVFYFCGFCE